MDKMKKGKLAKRAKSFKEDVFDIFNFLSPNTSTAGLHQASVQVKPLPIRSQASNGNEQKNELLYVIKDVPASTSFNQHFTNEINKNIRQVL